MKLYIVGIHPFGKKSPPIFYQYEDATGKVWFVQNFKQATRFTSKVLAESVASQQKGQVWRLKSKAPSPAK